MENRLPASVLMNKKDRRRELAFAIMAVPSGNYENNKDYRAAHMQYLQALHDTGELIGAGPLLDESGVFYDGDGLIIISAPSVEAARIIADNDPFHQQDVRRYCIKPWLLSEGAMQEVVLPGNTSNIPD